MMSNFWKTMRFSIIVFSFFYGCVGPPEPDHGLIENKPVVVNLGHWINSLSCGYIL